MSEPTTPANTWIRDDLLAEAEAIAQEQKNELKENDHE